MRKKIIALLSALCIGTAAAGLAACNNNKPTGAAAPENGGFETGDLTGWSIEYGTAFDNDCVSSVKTFTFENDADQNEIPVNHTGNWYLSGKTFYGGKSGEETGAIRSTEFLVPQDGVISMKLAGGALTTGKGSVNTKNEGKICYVGIYRSSDDKMLARQTNEYFIEHTEGYVLPDKYAAGVYNTDNFYEYILDMSKYAGEKVYIRVVDNDDSNYYGYIAVDDIRIGEEANAQDEGTYSEKTHTPAIAANPENEYEIKNGGFETGNLSGWTVVEGEAFADAGVNAKSTWWAENITYSRDGNYHYGVYNPTATGVMRSSTFTLGGSGYVSWKLGGCRDNGSTYIRFMMQTGEGEFTEVVRFSNFKFYDFQFPYVQNGLRLINMVQYYTDLSHYLGEKFYIEVVDNSTAGDDAGCVVLDSVKTYWKEKPVWYDRECYCAVFDDDIYESTDYQIANGGFETGDLTGWTASWTNDEQQIGVVTANDTWWAEKLSFNRKGSYHFSSMIRNAEDTDNISYEGNTGTLTSSAFTVAGSGWVSFLLGGGKNYNECYISVIDAVTNQEYLRYGNLLFNDLGLAKINNGSNLLNMVQYKADLSSLKGKSVKLQIVDNATGDWGLITADSFVTYHKRTSSIPSNANLAVDLLTLKLQGKDYDNVPAGVQVLNGDFESGTLIGWQLTGNIGGISDENSWWAECITYNKDGKNFFSGWKGSESETGTLTSSAFTVGGSGWITFKLGGAKNPALCYVEIIDAQTNRPITKYVNSKFSDAGFGTMGTGTVKNPLDAGSKGVYLANMVLYKADLSDYIGRSVKIRVVDNAVNDWGVIFVDSFVTYYETVAALPENATEAVTYTYEVLNGGFESGDLTGWTVLTDGMTGGVVDMATYWGEQLPTNQSGSYHLNGWETGIGEADSWAIRSKNFTLGGSGYISVKMGGKAAAVRVYKADGTLLGVYKASHFSDTNFPTVSDDYTVGGSWADMRTYCIDLQKYIGQELYIELHDIPVEGGWAHAFFDDVITYYETAPDVANRYDTVKQSVSGEDIQLKWKLAANTLKLLGEDDENQVLNGDFESGDLTGWTILTDGMSANSVKGANTYWGEKLPYNQGGSFHLDGWDTGIAEADSWAVRSQNFTLGGSGYVSVKMGGNAAAVKVFKADGTLIGEYKANHFSDGNFPTVSDDHTVGGSWADMRTYCIDLHDYIGEELYIELHDIGGGSWAHAFFDDVITYYETAPDYENGYDVVKQSNDGEDIQLKWRLAVKTA